MTKDGLEKLFESTAIKGMVLKNRIVRSATWEGMATEDGKCTDGLLGIYRGLASGGVGLIISSYAYVREDGKGGSWMIGMHDDSVISGYKNLTDAVHKSGTSIICQIVHTGALAFPERIGNRQPIAPSAVEERVTGIIPREMTEKDIRELITSFTEAAFRAKQCGFDGVQLHGAHGFLISQFLSPYSNLRTDKYGGNTSNRVRFCLDVYQSVRNAVGENYPVMIKINCHDFVEGEGISLKDSLYLAKKLGQYGIDCIEVSGGVPASGDFGPSRQDINSVDDEAYFLEMAEEIKRVSMVPVMLVGGLRTPKLMEQILRNDLIDYISMSRPFIYEPDLVKRWSSGDHKKAKCISCNDCFAPAKEGKGVYCVTRRRLETKNKK